MKRLYKMPEKDKYDLVRDTEIVGFKFYDCENRVAIGNDINQIKYFLKQGYRYDFITRSVADFMHCADLDSNGVYKKLANAPALEITLINGQKLGTCADEYTTSE